MGGRQSHPQVPCLACQGWAELKCRPACSEFNYCRKNEPSSCSPTTAVRPINGWCIVSEVPCVAHCLWQLRCCSRAWLWDLGSPQTSPDRRYWSELAGLGASASNTYKYQELSPSYQGSSTWGSPAELGAQATLQDGNTPNLCCLLWGDSFGSGRDLLT